MNGGQKKGSKEDVTNVNLAVSAFDTISRVVTLENIFHLV